MDLKTELDHLLPRLAASASTQRPETSTPALPVSSPTLPDWLLPCRRLGPDDRPRLMPAKERRREWIHPAGREKFLDAARTGRGWPLYFHGLQGRGKTSTALWFLDFVRVGSYLTARQAIDFEFSPDWDAKTAFRRLWHAADLAVLDQFGGAGKHGPGQTQAILDLLDVREGRPTIVVSNIPPDQLQEVFDAQIRSRIEGGTKVEFRGPDFRVARARTTP